MFVANKVCRFGGRPYVNGETVPEKYIDPRGVKRLLDADILREVPDKPQASSSQVEQDLQEPLQEETEETFDAVECEETSESTVDGDYESMDRIKLYHIAKNKGLDVKSTMSKAKLIELLV